MIDLHQAGTIEIVLGLKERREREKKARRESILCAARELLHQKGINGASMNQIAKKAELGVATLYSYFKNKEDLYLVIQKEGLELLKEYTLQKLSPSDDAKEKLRKIATSFLEFSQKRKNYYYVINYYISTPEILFEPRLKDEIDSQAENSLNVAEKVIREGIECGLFIKTNSKRCSIMFWAMVQGLTQYRKLESTILKDDNYQEIFEFSIEQFIRSISV